MSRLSLQHGNVTLRDLPKLEILKPLPPKKVAQRRQQKEYEKENENEEEDTTPSPTTPPTCTQLARHRPHTSGTCFRSWGLSITVPWVSASKFRMYVLCYDWENCSKKVVPPQQTDDPAHKLSRESQPPLIYTLTQWIKRSILMIKEWNDGQWHGSNLHQTSNVFSLI